MKRIIIACRTLEQELLEAMEALDCHAPVIWLEAGEHNVPRQRRCHLEATLAQCAGYDTVLLAMTFCGNSLAGLNSAAHTLVLPRFDDCIPLLLGKEQRENGSYYFSAGWLSGKDNLLTEYERSAKKYGPVRADRLFGAMLRHYRRLVWLWDDRSPTVPDNLQRFSEHFGLPLVAQRKDLVFLNRLISGDWDENFLIIPPETEITLNMRSSTEGVPQMQTI